MKQRLAGSPAVVRQLRSRAGGIGTRMGRPTSPGTARSGQAGWITRGLQHARPAHVLQARGRGAQPRDRTVCSTSFQPHFARHTLSVLLSELTLTMSGLSKRRARCGTAACRPSRDIPAK